MVNKEQSGQFTDDWQRGLADGMAIAVMMTIVPLVDAMVKIFVGPKLEKRVGRPLTEEHWNYYWEEKAKKQQWERYHLQVTEREIIRRFVWEEGG